MSSSSLKIGFIPLVDCALLAIAQELHFFAAQGLAVELQKAQAWGAIRDNLISGKLDAAHLLITMPIQSALASDTSLKSLCHAFTLSQNGNAIVLANHLWNNGVRDAIGLAERLATHPQKQIRFGVVFPKGTQEYFLRTWLAQGGIGLDKELVLKIVAPQEMVGHLRLGEIDGFCAGDPWTRRATSSKLGRLVAESRTVLPFLGEKVLGVRSEWHQKHTKEHGKIIRALAMASVWLENPANLEMAVEIVASKRYVNTQKAVVEGALRSRNTHDIKPRRASRFYVENSNAPSRTHIHWYLEQMVRFGHISSIAASRVEISSMCLEKFYHDSISELDRSFTTPINSRSVDSILL